MKRLTKLPLPKVGEIPWVQCPIHHPAFATKEHERCLEEWKKNVEKANRNSIEYKQIQVLNELVDRLNEHYEEMAEGRKTRCKKIWS